MGPACMLDASGARLRLSEGSHAMLRHLFIAAYRSREEAMYVQWLNQGPDIAWEPARRALAGWQTRGRREYTLLVQVLAGQVPTGDLLARRGWLERDTGLSSLSYCT